jgi:DNA-binding XRE family transcriptional regulator
MTNDSKTSNENETEASSVKSRLKNNVRRLREDRLLTKAELARKAGVSTLTIDRVESGQPCRMDTKRKIILALGMTVADKDQVFVKTEEATAADDDNTDRNG